MRPAKRKCSVPGCDTKFGSFFSFPHPSKNSHLFQTWLKKVNNPLLLTKPPHSFCRSNLVCAKHFRPEDRENSGRKGLKSNTIPTLHLNEGPQDPLDNYQGITYQVIKEQVTNPLSGQLEKSATVLTNVPEDSTTDISHPILISKKLCRVCLQEKSDMWTFFSVLTFDDGSTLDVVEAFQYLTGELVQEFADIHFPKQICEKCVDLLVHAFSFKQLYQKTKQILTNVQSKQLGIKEQTNEILDSVCKVEDDTVLLEDVQDLSVLGNEDTVKTAAVKKLHRCPICSEKFTALELRQHCKSHDVLKSYFKAAPKFDKKIRFYAKQRTNNIGLFYKQNILHKCPFCFEEFSGEQFKEHVKQHRREGNFRCNICKRVFIGRNHMKAHQLIHKQKAPFRCEECGRGFFNEKTFNFHKLRHTGTENFPFQCKFCSERFTNPEHLRRHTFGHQNVVSYYEHYKTKKVSCKRCLQKFNTTEGLDKHNCRLTCLKCRKGFSTQNEYTRHACKFSYKKQKNRSAAPRNLCHFCGKTLKNLYLHIQQCHATSPPQKKYSCAHCDRKFRFREALSRHISQVHLKLLKFQCQYCPKRFVANWNLIVHERIHVGSKSHLCNVCGKGFLEQSYLRKHLKVHLRKDMFLSKDSLDGS